MKLNKRHVFSLSPFIAGGAITLVGGAITWGLMRLGVKVSIGWLRATVNVLLGAAVLFACDRLLPGLTVHAFSGAFLASTAIAIIAWLLSLYPKRINKGTTINRQRPIS